MTWILIALLLLALLLALTGIVGAILPALPGPPLSFVSLLVAYFACPGYISTELLFTLFALTLLSVVLDYMAPIWMTKVGGGTSAAVRGSTVGLILGLFFMPMGLIVGPLLGAFAGEMLSSRHVGRALRMAILSFISFLLTTGFKLVLSALMAFYAMEAFGDRLLG